MTKSDELMLAAVRMRTGLSVNGRVVSAVGDRVTISLYDVPTICVRFDEGDIRLSTSVPVTRKSAKVINAVLQAFTDCRMKSMNGVWLLENRKGEIIPLRECFLTIPITRDDVKRSGLERYMG